MSEMTPREIVQELDKHIVGQAAAKRAVAIALRTAGGACRCRTKPCAPRSRRRTSS